MKSKFLRGISATIRYDQPLHRGCEMAEATVLQDMDYSSAGAGRVVDCSRRRGVVTKCHRGDAGETKLSCSPVLVWVKARKATKQARICDLCRTTKSEHAILGMALRMSSAGQKSLRFLAHSQIKSSCDLKVRIFITSGNKEDLFVQHSEGKSPKPGNSYAVSHRPLTL